MNYTKIMELRKPEGGEYYDIEDFNKNSDLLDAAVNSKANKPLSAMAGNFPMLDAGGNLGDSGKCAASFAAANHEHDAAYAPISHVSDAAVHVGADEKTAISAVASKADKSYVDSALSTKMNEWASFLVGDITDLINKPSGKYYIGPNVTGHPESFKSGLADIICDKNSIMITMYDPHIGQTGKAITWQRYGNKQSGWSPWVQLATVEPPQKHSIPFESGWSSITDSYFYKNQFGEVVVRAEARKDSPVDPLGTLFVLPEGYRPPLIVQFSVTFNSPFATVIVMVEPNGRVSTRSGVTEAARGYFMNISFLAKT